MYELSIVIPTLNEEDHIQNILQDILKNTLISSCYEIIVADSGSNDQTKNRVKTLQKRYPDAHIKFVVAAKKGVSIARNTGAQHAKGTYILFLDADVRIATDLLTLNLEEVKRKKLDVAACYVIPDSGSWIDMLLFSIVNNCILRTFQYTAKPLALGAAILAKREVHNLIGGFNPQILFGEDIEYVTQSKKFGKFRMLNSQSVTFSMRRGQKEGRFKLVGKAVHGFLYHMRHKSMKNIKIAYEYGKYKSSSTTTSS